MIALTRLTHAAAHAHGRTRARRHPERRVDRGLPTDAAHERRTAATKAFVRFFTESLHEELKGTGVSVTVLAPGFTRTEFQQRAGVEESAVPSMFWQNADEVARAGLDGLAKNRAVVVPGGLNRIASAFIGITPHAVTRRVAKQAMQRGT